MTQERKPPSKDAVACQTFGAVAGIGGLFTLCCGIALKDDPVGLTCFEAGVFAMIIGPPIFILGTILRIWR
jgi:hypothetical protein